MRPSALMHSEGRSFAILPRENVKEGFRDIDHDDYKEGHFLLELTQNLRSRTGHRVAVSTAFLTLWATHANKELQQSQREWSKE